MERLKQPELVLRFRKHICNADFDFHDDRVSSVLDCLYVAYADSQGRDPEEIDKGFMLLEHYLGKVGMADNNAIFDLVCKLCLLYEKRAFQDGLQIGGHLMLELHGK